MFSGHLQHGVSGLRADLKGGWRRAGRNDRAGSVSRISEGPHVRGAERVAQLMKVQSKGRSSHAWGGDFASCVVCGGAFW